MWYKSKENRRSQRYAMIGYLKSRSQRDGCGRSDRCLLMLFVFIYLRRNRRLEGFCPFLTFWHSLRTVWAYNNMNNLWKDWEFLLYSSLSLWLFDSRSGTYLHLLASSNFRLTYFRANFKKVDLLMHSNNTQHSILQYTDTRCRCESISHLTG